MCVFQDAWLLTQLPVAPDVSTCKGARNWRAWSELSQPRRSNPSHLSFFLCCDSPEASDAPSGDAFLKDACKEPSDSSVLISLHYPNTPSTSALQWGTWPEAMSREHTSIPSKTFLHREYASPLWILESGRSPVLFIDPKDAFSSCLSFLPGG